jgi:transcriptional regulator with XRE-family HTH domain
MTNQQITSKIRKIREQNGICQEAVAAAIGLSVQSYSKLERGETQLSVERLYNIAAFLKMPIPEILGFEMQQVFNNSPYKQGGSYVAYNSTEIEYVKNLYERLIEEKENVIVLLKSQVSNH